MVDWCNVSCIQLGLQKFACILENITQINTLLTLPKLLCWYTVPPKQNMSNNKWHKLCSVHRLCWLRWSKTPHKVGYDFGIQQQKLGIPKLSTNSRTAHRLHLKLILHDGVTWQVTEFIANFTEKLPQSKGAGTSNILTDCDALKKKVSSYELTCQYNIAVTRLYLVTDWKWNNAVTEWTHGLVRGSYHISSVN